MARKRCNEEDILRLLREIDIHLQGGADVVITCRIAGISDKTYHGWHKRYTGATGARFSVIRYGNAMESCGSVIPSFLSLSDKGVLPITDHRRARFIISLEQWVELLWNAFEDIVGGKIYLKKIPSMEVTDLARVLATDAKEEVVGICAGEKLHEQMIGAEDAFYTYEYEDPYNTLLQINNLVKDSNRIKNGNEDPEGFVYSSDNNSEWMSGAELNNWIDANLGKIGSI